MLCRGEGGARPRPTWEPFRFSVSLPGIKNPNCRNENVRNVGIKNCPENWNIELARGFQ